MENKVSLKERIIAIFVVILVIASLVAFSFAVPWTKVHAASGQEMYLDSLYTGGGASVIGSAKGSWFDFVQIAIDIALKNPIPAGGKYNTSDLNILAGWYYDGQDKHACVSSFNSEYFVSDELIMASSDQFLINASVVVDNDQACVFSSGINANSYNGTFSTTAVYSSVSYSCDINDRLGITKFNPSSTHYSSTISRGYTRHVSIWYSSSTIPIINWANLGNYCKAYSSEQNPNHNVIAGLTQNEYNYLIQHQLKDIPELSNIEFSSWEDFIINYWNPYIEIEYPDLVVYLYDPSDYEDTTDTTGSSGGCNCQVYVYVTEYFDPEINVYVTEYITVTNNVEIELPSEWVQDYTFATDPTELPVPTLPTDPLTSEPVTYPSIDESQMQEYEQEFGDGIRFWLWLTGEFVEKLGLQTICGFVFVVAVAGFVLWKTGGSGGGKND